METKTSLKDASSVYNQVTQEGKTPLFFMEDDVYLGMITVADPIKKDSREAIQQLENMGIEVVMITGDNEATANAIAHQAGVHKVYASVLPSQKEAVIQKLKKRGKVAMVGDGINDAPVLSRADIGIAMGALGSDAAIEAADIVLMDDDPLKISKAIKISRKCLRIVYENIYFAIGIKLICLVLGAIGIANMWVAIFADVGVMVIAVINAIRALFVKNL